MKRILLFIIGILLLTACDSGPSGSGTTAYPGPNSSGTSAYPAPGGIAPPANLPTRTPLPKPGASTGTITGRLVQASTGTPLSALAVYVGDLSPMTPGPDYLITLQQNSSPHVALDQDGYFALTDIKPGTYGLILWSPIKSSVVADPAKQNKELLVTVKPGEITDIGEVVVDWS